MSNMGEFAETIMKQKYSQTKKDGNLESWDEIAYRVTKNVMKSVDYTMKESTPKEIYNIIKERKFIPGGRYLYASGREFHQVQNCLLLRADDSREGWSDLLQKSSMALMTGAGIGVDYSSIRAEGKPIRKTGGTATGPISLAEMLNECGRGIMQGGSRRSAIWAGLNWNHPDIQKFISIKNWSEDIKKLKAKDFNFPAPLDGTNISVQLDDKFFNAYHDDKSPLHARAHSVYWSTVKQMLQTAEPGFSIDLGKNKKETLRNAPVSGSTRVLTRSGYQSVKDIVNKEVVVWTGKQWAKTIFKKTKENANLVRVELTNGRAIVCDPEHPFIIKEYIGAGKNKKIEFNRVEAVRLNEDQKVHSDLPIDTAFLKRKLHNLNEYGLGFVFGDGSIKEKRGEISYHHESKKECFRVSIDGLNARAGKSSNRAYFNTHYKDKASLLDKNVLSPDFIAGWFDADGCYTRKLLRLSNNNFYNLYKLQESLDFYGIKTVIRKDGKSSYKPENEMYTLSVLSSSILRFKSVIPTIRLNIDLDKDYKPYREPEIRVKSIESLNDQEDVFCCDVGVEEHSFMAEGVIISNCTEVTSEDDSDICNLGSINLARIESLEEMEKVVKLSTIFLLAGTIYSDVPYAKVDMVRTKNRRLGLGLMGVHEWLLKKGKPYEPDEDLKQYMKVYQKSGKYAEEYANKWDISVPVKTRALAPTGSIGILGETTTGIEPIFCVAYKRRYLKHRTWHYQYVIDPTAKKLIDQYGINPENIEDAYDLSENIEKRVAFQYWVQQFVDHAISSTINLPAWGTEYNNDSTVQDFGKMLIKYLPGLRGITCYPDGARGGQPLTPVKYNTAIKHTGKELVEEYTDVCDITKGGSCGD